MKQKPLLEPFVRGFGANKYPRDVRCIWGSIMKGTIPRVPPFSLLKVGPSWPKADRYGYRGPQLHLFQGGVTPVAQ